MSQPSQSTFAISGKEVKFGQGAVTPLSEKCIHQLFEEQAARTPGEVAVACGDQHLTYGELNQKANHLAHCLQRQGVRPEMIVAIFLDRSLDLIVAILGVLKAGGAYLPIDLAYPKDRVAFMLEDAQVSVLLTHHELAANLPAHQANVVCLDDPQLTVLSSQALTSPANTASPSSLAYVIFTSGSTGQPKGALITHHNVVRLFQCTDHWFHFNEKNIWTLFHSCAFDFSVWEIWGALFYGGRLIIVPYMVSRSPEAFYELLSREKVTVLNQTPSAFRQLMQAEESARETKSLALRYVIFGGEALEMRSLKPWFDRHGDQCPQLINMYGITETTVHVTYRPLTKDDVQCGSIIGIPIPDLKVHILDAHLQPVPIGTSAEMFVAGAGLARGYLNRPELTAERFFPDPFSREPGARLYRTGDLARFLSNGDIEYLGRIDQQVKIRGFRIELGEIESVLAGLPGVREAVVLAREEVPGDKRLVAYLTIKAGESLKVSELRSLLQAKLPDYMVPSAFVTLDRFPLTPNGKVNRKVLPAPGSERPELGANYVAPSSSTEKILADVWAKSLGLEKVGVHDNFFDLGAHSLLLVEVQDMVSEMLKTKVSIVEMLQYPTISSLARHLSELSAGFGRLQKVQEAGSPANGSRSPAPNEGRIIKKESAFEGIAIIGMTGRFPGAANLDEFWRNLVAGVESISTFTDEELAASGLDVPALRKDPSYVPARGILHNAEWFDAAFFGINGRHAEVTDPQQRLFFEASWEALENAGYDPERVDGRIGVYAGMSGSTYYLKNLHSKPDLVALVGERVINMGNEKDYLATYVAYKLNLRGPAINVNTACSTSLVAVCQACQGLLNYQCDLALAGGVSITFPQRSGVRYQEGGIFSPDGHCRTFDARAQGTVSSDGIGIVVLKRLAEALNDGDQIYAVIKGFGLNNDGAAKIGFTAPSVDGQAEAIAMALAQADFDPGTISYVEAHGTATPLGDPIEVAGLNQAFRLGSVGKNACAVGSVKSNIGHLDAASGVAGLIKTALALKNKMLPPTLHFTTPNPKIDFTNSPFFVNSMLRKWENVPMPRRAGVSSFGLGGTNAHVVLEEAPSPQPASPSRPWQLLLLSAKTASALDAATANLLAHLKANPHLNLADAAFTLQVGRAPFQHRRMLHCRNIGEAILALDTRDSKRVQTQRVATRGRPVVFMFPGQGAQYVNMGAELYRTEPIFKDALDRCAELLLPLLGLDLRQVLFPAAEKVQAAEDLLIQTRITQPALFAIEYAMARLWISWGLQPRAMIGHSVGEYVAACLAGVFTLEEALEVVANRARLVQSQPGGAMLAVRLPEKEMLPLLTDQLSIAAINSPSLCVVSGPFDAVAELEARLKKQGVAGRRLQTSHAFHSAMMDPVLVPLTELLEKVKFHKPSIPYVSNVTGRWITDSEAMDPKYWVSHVRQTVRFADGVGELLKDPETILLEVGPGQTLGVLASQHPGKAASHVVLSSFAASKDQEVAALLTALGNLWLKGVPVDWPGFYKHEKRRRITLPTYPFERKRYWVEPAARAANRPPDAPDVISLTPDKATAALPTHAPPGETASEKNGAGVMSRGCDVPGAAVPSRKERILAVLTAQFQELSGANLTGVGPSVSFMEMGLDSLFLAQASQAIEKRFEIRIAFRQLLEELTTLNELADFIDQKLPLGALPAVVPPAPAMPSEVSASMPSHSALAAIQTQLQALARQIESLRQALPSQFPAALPVAPSSKTERTATAETEEAQAKLAGPPPGIASKVADTELAEVLTFPLSEAQMEVWLAAGSDREASCAFNQILPIHLRSQLSIEALRRALQELVNRHDALRTTFLPDGSGQQIHSALKLHVPLRDLSSLSTAEAQRNLAEAIALEDETPFDLAKGPLLRAQILKLSDTCHVLLMAAHHLVLDGWSIGVLLRELSQLYSAKSQGAPDGLAPAMQYREYLKWQSLPENRAHFADAETYWLRQFANLPDAVELPADRPRPTVKTYRAANECLVLGPALYSTLKDAAGSQGCTIFTYLLASLKVWLHRLTGQADLVVGIHAAGQVAIDSRKNQGSRSLVGHCVNLLPLRSHCNGNERFTDYLKDIKHLVLDAYEHQNYTFGSLVKKLNLQREASRVPLLPLAVNLSRVTRNLRLPDSELVLPPKGFNFFDLSIEAMDSGQDLCIDCRFNSDLFDVTTIDRWLGHWKSLLEGMLSNPERPISTLPILNEAERQRVLVDWNQTQVEYPKNKCLHELIEEQVERTPDATAVVFENEQLTYREINYRANQLARYLHGLGVGPDTLVGICVERSLEMVVGLLGILKAGGAYVPLDPIYPKGRLTFMLEDSGVGVLLTQASLAESLPAHQAQIVRLDADWPAIRRESPVNPHSSVAANHLAYMIYTSGSTGKPKGVQIQHGAVVNFLHSMRKAPGLTAQDRLLAITTLSFDIAGLELWLPLMVGAQIVIASREKARDGQALGELLARCNATVMQATPSTWKILLSGDWRGNPHLKILCGGEPWPTDLAQQLLEKCDSLWNMYGPTETTIWSSACRVNPDEEVLIGGPIANTQFYVVDLHLQPLPVGVPGELCIGGDGLARGYFKMAELTNERFVRDPFADKPGARMYKTGDLVRWQADGKIEFLGRMDHQVKIRGFRIELGEIESVLTGYPGVREAVVVAREDVPGDKRLVAYLTVKNGLPPKDSELRGLLQAKLPEYLVPSAFVTLDRFPLTPNGKVDRKALPQPDQARAADAFVPPGTPTEVSLAKIWGEVLGLKQAGLHDNFFESGGHSLLATRAASRASAAFQVDLTLHTLFEHPTLVSLAEQIDTLLWAREKNHESTPCSTEVLVEGSI